MKRTLLLSAAMLLSGCAHIAPIDPTAPPPTAAQMAAAKVAVAQANFNMACKYAGGAWQLAKPIASIPAIAVKLGPNGALAVKALDTAITTTCAANIDVSNADAIVQNIYDVGGKVIALVIAAQTSP